MKLRIIDYLSDIEEFNGVSFSAKIKCTCGENEFSFFHTGKQTMGIFSPCIIKRDGQLILKAICSSCEKSIIIYDSAKDGVTPKETNKKYEFVPFVSNKLPEQFSVVIKYNYFPDNMKIGNIYSNKFEDCFIYITDKKGREIEVLIEE